ncbi:MAG: Rne/Rng family ribonuclease [Candidatus Cloacimonetes bacterium]|nr:Rne/Rng family ribonuclease [Candidatus Cloacimonadota bacterium]
MKEKVFSELIINVHPFETRVALLEDNKLVELFTEKKEQQIVVGNIYKGIIRNVLPGMGAAFVDIGLARTAFLHFSDIDGQFLPPAKRRMLKSRDSSKISRVLSPGQEILVQVKKDPLGKKGARITGKISIPGKFLVYMPSQNKVSISRKITSNAEKNRIREIIREIKDPAVGLIVRTDTEGITKEDFIQEYNGLHKTWKFVEKQNKYAKAPYCLFNQSDLSFSLIRDLFSTEIEHLVVDDKRMKNEIVSNLKTVMPELIDRVEYYNEESPIFDTFGIEKELQMIFRSRIGLPSGGNITIQQTEALVAIDVNTGSFTGNRNYEETICRTNIEAAIELARQIRLRDLCGIMVVDFIDMTSEADQDEVFSVLKYSMKRDRAKNKIFPFSPLGLVEISRKRTRPSLLLSYSEMCPYCNGTGRLLSRDSMAVQISRWLQRAKFFIKNEPLKLRAHPNVITFLKTNSEVLESTSNQITFEASEDMKLDEFVILSGITGKELTRQYNA